MAKKKASDFRYNTGETKVPWAAVGENYNAEDLMAIVKFMMKGEGEDYDAAVKAVESAVYALDKVSEPPAKLSLDAQVAKAEEMCDEFLGTEGCLFVTNCTAGFEIASKYANLQPGDEVIVPAITFAATMAYPLSIGCKIVFADVDPKTLNMDPKDVAKKITDKTKILVLPFPNNPTGAIMRREDLEAIRDVIIEKDLFVLSDEIYSELTYQEEHVSPASLEGMWERTLTINGFSKAYAMTGWRLGYACAPHIILEQMLKIHQFAIMCAPTTSQYAAVEALRNGDKDVQEMRESYNQRRRFLVHTFRKMGLKTFEPFGAFYMFPSIKELGMTSEEFAMELLKREKVAVVPGTAFGDCGEGFLRISYAYSLEELKHATDRMARFVEEIRKEKGLI